MCQIWKSVDIRKVGSFVLYHRVWEMMDLGSLGSASVMCVRLHATCACVCVFFRVYVHSCLLLCPTSSISRKLSHNWIWDSVCVLSSSGFAYKTLLLNPARWCVWRNDSHCLSEETFSRATLYKVCERRGTTFACVTSNLHVPAMENDVHFRSCFKFCAFPSHFKRLHTI